MINMKSGSGNSQLCAVLSYFLIGIIWYFADENLKKDSLAKFHAKQAVVLFIFSIIWSIVINMVFGMLLFGMIGFMWRIIHLLSYVPLIFTVIGIINAANDNQKPLPIISSRLHFFSVGSPSIEINTPEVNSK